MQALARSTPASFPARGLGPARRGRAARHGPAPLRAEKADTAVSPAFPEASGVGVGGSGRSGWEWAGVCRAHRPGADAAGSPLLRQRPTTRRTQKIINAITVFLNNSPLNEGEWAWGGGR